MSYRDRERFDNSRPDQYGQEHYGRRQYGQPSYDQQRGGWDRQHHGWQEAGEHQPFAPSAFGESESPRYFGTGTQGHGGGPSFTGGTYGTSDWRSDPGGRTPYRQGRQQRRYPLGPKGYTRSDERLREDISERLMQAYDIDSSEVTVQVLGGKVTLEGTVPNRYMKHAIEDIADSAAGVQDVDNRIRVTSSRWSTNSDAGSVATNANNPVAGGRTTTTGLRRES
jgi:hypothetical protein